MLTKLKLVDFKSFVDETIELAPLTFIVGANASGKSNLFDAIRLLKGLGEGLSLQDVIRGRADVWRGIRGGASEIARSGSSEFRLESEWALERETLAHLLEVQVDPRVQIARERLEGAGKKMGQYLFDTHAPALGNDKGLVGGGGLRVAFKSTGGGRNATEIVHSDQSLLVQLGQERRLHPLVPDMSQLLRASMRRALFLDIRPHLMRGFASRRATDLGSSGENISAVLWELCRDTDQKLDIVDWLSELCAPTVQDIKFIEVEELDDVMLQLVEEGGTPVSARSLSDGTLRFLGELTALLTAPEGSLLLVEEIENSLHPARMHLLVQLLVSATSNRNIQVLATTHSPLVLSALKNEAPDILRQALICGRIRGTEGTVARRLGDLEYFDDVVERSGIDRLFTTGWLERAL